MNHLINTPSILIALAAIVIVSYLFNLLAKKTRIPSVLMLLGMGILFNLGGHYAALPQPDVRPALEILGSVGLIMIVLEAALDLELR
ncbi:MAG TPA: sodium:proton exchanger, partial [Cryomorphaceae bacterium]|nr:sodium:proton exchanger [Cryomorphaceae bacterium]